jgi:hypothetical protein
VIEKLKSPPEMIHTQIKVILMPHVVLLGEFNFEEVMNRFSPVFVKEKETILKTMELFLSKDKKSLLIESLVIEKGNKKQFLTMVSTRDDGLVVRIYPAYEIERSKGVFRLAAEIAKKLLQLNASATIGKTNLQEYMG